MGEVTPIKRTIDDPFIATEYGDGIEVATTTFGSSRDPQQELVFLQHVDTGVVAGLTAPQARALAARLVKMALTLEDNDAADWVEGAVTVGRILHPAKRGS